MTSYRRVPKPADPSPFRAPPPKDDPGYKQWQLETARRLLGNPQRKADMKAYEAEVARNKESASRAHKKMEEDAAKRHQDKKAMGGSGSKPLPMPRPQRDPPPQVVVRDDFVTRTGSRPPRPPRAPAPVVAGGGVMQGRPRNPMPPAGMAQNPMAAAMMQRSMTPMAAQQIMPMGRAYAKGGMVGCDWKPKNSSTMRGAARKG